MADDDHGAELTQQTGTKQGGPIEIRLREAGREFIKAHDRTAGVIREAAEARMSPDAIAQASELSSQTVGAFLRASRD
jgi:hypothetical protein